MECIQGQGVAMALSHRACKQKHAKITKIERQNGEVIGAQLGTRLPCSEITTESALGVHLKSCAHNLPNTFPKLKV